MDAISVSFSSENISSGSSVSISSIGSSNGANGVVDVSPSDVFSSSNLAFDGLSIHNDDVEPSGTAHSPPLGDAFALGTVFKLSRSSWNNPPYRCYSYALYCGNGRVIHSWSSMRTHFRVRIDSLRSLAAAGVTMEDATEEFDAFCAKVLGSTPLPPREIVARAREALHCGTHGRRCSVVLIVHARYGTVATSMAKSLLAIAPLVIKLNGLGAQFSNGELSMRDALGVVLHYIDPKNYPMPPPAPAAQASESEPTVAVPLKTVLLAKAWRMNAIDGLLRSDVAPFLAAWIMIALKKGDPKASTVAVVIALLKRAKASLFFSPMARAFTIVLSSDANLLERLVRERMECGICFVNYTDVPTKLLECSHVLCGSCFASLRTRICPYCREPITFERQITNHYKALANETIREQERLQMEANDVDAPPCSVSTPSTTGAEPETATGLVSSLLAIRAALARAVSPDGDDDDLVVILQRLENEKRESTAMVSEDADAPAVEIPHAPRSGSPESKIEMDHHLSRGKCRRKLSPEHALFAEGNALRSSKYYQSMGLSGADGMEEEEEDKPVVFVCRLFNCHGVGFHSLRAYEEHYDLVHRNVCRECFRSFLSLRLLDLHLSETHDAYFRVLAKRQPMYVCLVDGCTQVFKHDDKRTKHLVADHQYPTTFSFHRVRRSPPRTQKTQAHKSTEEKKDADAMKIAKAHARKLKRREKKKVEARERKRNGGGEPMDTSEPRCVEGEDDAAGDEAMEDAGEVGALTERMKQLMVPSSISFGRRRQQRR